MHKSDEFVKLVSQRYPIYREQQRTVVTYSDQPGDNVEPDIDKKLDGDPNYWRQYESVNTHSTQQKVLVFHCPVELLALPDMQDLFLLAIKAFLAEGFTLYFWNNTQPQKMDSESLFNTFANLLEFSTRRKILEKMVEYQISEQEVVVFDCIDVENICNLSYVVYRTSSSMYSEMLPRAYGNWAGYQNRNQRHLYQWPDNYMPGLLFMNLARYATLSQKAFRRLIQSLALERRLSLILLQGAYDSDHLDVFLSKFNEVDDLKILTHFIDDLAEKALSEQFSATEKPFTCKSLEIITGHEGKGVSLIGDGIDLLNVCTQHSQALTGLALASPWIQENIQTTVDGWLWRSPNLSALKTLEVQQFVLPHLPIIEKAPQLESLSIDNASDLHCLLESDVRQQLNHVTKLRLAFCKVDGVVLSKLLAAMPSLTDFTLSHCGDITAPNDEEPLFQCTQLKSLTIEYTQLPLSFLLQIIAKSQGTLEKIIFRQIKNIFDKKHVTQCHFPQLKELICDSLGKGSDEVIWSILNHARMLEKLTINADRYAYIQSKNETQEIKIGEHEKYMESIFNSGTWENLTHIVGSSLNASHVPLMKVISGSRNLQSLQFEIASDEEIFDGCSTNISLAPLLVLRHLDLASIETVTRKSERAGYFYMPQKKERVYQEEGFFCKILTQSPNVQHLKINGFFHFDAEFNTKELKRLENTHFTKIKNIDRLRCNWKPNIASSPFQLTKDTKLRVAGCGGSEMMDLTKVAPSPAITELMFFDEQVGDGKNYTGVCNFQELNSLLAKLSKLEKLKIAKCLFANADFKPDPGLSLAHLTMLDVSHSFLEADLLIYLLSAAPNLSVLNLQNCWFLWKVEATIADLLKSKPLSVIHIFNCGFSATFSENLRMTHPNIIIIDDLRLGFYREQKRSARTYVNAENTVSANNNAQPAHYFPSFYDTNERPVRGDVWLLDHWKKPEFKPVAVPALRNNLVSYYLDNRATNKNLKIGIRRMVNSTGDSINIPSYSTRDKLIGLNVRQDFQLRYSDELRRFIIVSSAKEVDFQYLIEISEHSNEVAPWKKSEIAAEIDWIKDIRLADLGKLENNEAAQRIKALPFLTQVATLEQYFLTAKAQRMDSRAKSDFDIEFYNNVISLHQGTCGERGIALAHILKALGHECLLQGNKSPHLLTAIKIEDEFWPIEVGGTDGNAGIPLALPKLESLINYEAHASEKPEIATESRMLQQLRPMPPKDITHFSHYSEWLMQQAKAMPSYKNQAILSFNEKKDIRKFINAMTEISSATEPCCVIQDISQLRYKTGRLTEGSEEKVDSEVIQFLNNPSRKGILFLVLQNWSAKWNPLFEENRLLGQYPVPDGITIFALCESSQNVSEDIVSRMGFATTFNFVHLLPNIVTEYQVKTEDVVERNYDKVVNLNYSEYWKDKVLRDYEFTEDGRCKLIPQSLILATQQPSRLLFINLPLHDEDFVAFFEGLLTTSGFFFNGETKRFADNTSIQWSTMPVTLALFRDRLRLLTEQTQSQWQYSLSAENFRQLFKCYVISAQGGFVKIPSLFAAHREQSLVMLLTSELEDNQWLELFQEAEKQLCDIRILVPPTIQLPRELSLGSAPPAVMQRRGLASPQNTVIISSELFHAASQLANELSSPRVIFVTESMSYSDLFVKIRITQTGYHTSDSEVWSELQNERTVLLVGQLSLTVQLKIATLFCTTPFLLVNQQKIACPGKLVILTNQDTAFTFVINRILRMPSTNTASKAEEKSSVSSAALTAEDSHRLYSLEVDTILQKSPYAILMSAENADVNHFLCEQYPDNYVRSHNQPITIHYGIGHFQAWLEANQSGLHLMVITDVDNVATRKIFINLIADSPAVLHQGKLIPVTKQQKIVFVVYPEHKNSMMRSLLAQFSERILSYQRLAVVNLPTVIPTQDQHRLQFIYAQLNKMGFTVTPSRHEIIACLDGILVEREKQLKYPGSYQYRPICPVMTGGSGIGKSKLAVSLLKVWGFVEAASEEAKTTDSRKHYYNLITTDINKYPEMSAVPQHQQVMAITLRAYNYGSVVIGDELNVNRNLMTFLAALLNRFDKTLKPLKKGFAFFGTQNPLNFKDRHRSPVDLQAFIYPIHTPNLDPYEVVAILERFGVTQYQARELTKEFYRAIEILKKQGNAFTLTVRDLFDYTKQQLKLGTLEYPSAPPGFWGGFFVRPSAEDAIFTPTSKVVAEFHH